MMLGGGAVPLNEAFTMSTEVHAGMGMRAEIQYRRGDGNATLVLRLTALEAHAAPIEVARIDDATVEITVSGDPEVDEFATVLKLLVDRLSERQTDVGEYSVRVENKLGKA